MSLVAAVFLISLVTSAATAHASSPKLAIIDVTVVDVQAGERRASQTVLIEGNRITAVGDAGRTAIPQDTRVLPGEGRFLIPGLWDMHTHAASTRGRTPRFWALFRAHGITGTREMGNDARSLRAAKQEATRLTDRAPRIVWSSPMLDGDPPAYDSSIAVPNAAAGRRYVREMSAAGFDFLKIYNGLSREAFLAVADEARVVGIPIAGELPDSMSPADAARAGMRTFEHLWNLLESCIPGALAARDAVRDLERQQASAHALRRASNARDRLWLRSPDATCVRDLIANVKAAGTAQVPTLAINRSYSFLDDEWPESDPRRQWIPKTVLSYWAELRTETLATYGPDTASAWHSRYAAEMKLLGQMSAAGIAVMAGSDATDWEPFIFPGASLSDELALLVQAGMTSAQALRAATSEPARFLGRSDLGTVATGKLADLVLLDADPLLDIRNVATVRAVIFDGRLQTRTDLDGLLADAVSRAERE